jgi:hypothetical protein
MRHLLPLLLLSFNPGCTCTEVKQLPPITTEFGDAFDRPALGEDWIATDAEAYRIENGELVVRRAYNHPLWLARPIPHDAVIEFDCSSSDDAGDLKVEIWGDGKSYATGPREAAYTSTAYNFIFGGWHNTLSTLARMHEHGEDRQTRPQPRVEKGRKYHWRIERKGAHVDWQIDGQPFLAFDDPAPLEGDGHRFFAINDWEAELHFDHLKITPR